MQNNILFLNLASRFYGSINRGNFCCCFNGAVFVRLVNFVFRVKTRRSIKKHFYDFFLGGESNACSEKEVSTHNQKSMVYLVHYEQVDKFTAAIVVDFVTVDWFCFDI